MRVGGASSRERGKDPDPWHLRPCGPSTLLSHHEHVMCLRLGFEKLETISFTPMHVTSELEV